jgi:RNA polymerase sigma factor (sigma-70 family)
MAQKWVKEERDQDLLILLLRRDQEGLSLLYDRYYSVLYRLAYRILGERTQSEEVAQDVMVEIWNKIHTYDPKLARFSSWLFHIARKRAIDRLKREKRHVVPGHADEEQIQRLTDPSASTEKEVERADLSHAIGMAVRELSKEQREIIDLMYFQGYTQTEISQREAIPLGTVKSRVRLAMNHLKKKLHSLAGREEPS